GLGHDGRRARRLRCPAPGPGQAGQAARGCDRRAAGPRTASDRTPGASDRTPGGVGDVKKGRVVGALVGIGGGLVRGAAKGLSSSLVYYKTPTELLQQGHSAVGERLRLGGLVVPGSVETAGARTTFVVTDDTSRMTVVDRGDLPELFTAGQGVVVEGS